MATTDSPRAHFVRADWPDTFTGSGGRDVDDLNLTGQFVAAFTYATSIATSDADA